MTIPIELTEGNDFDSLKALQNEHETELSCALHEQINKHIEALGVNEEEKIELLSKELSLLQATLRFVEINKVLFRSQFELFNVQLNDGNTISENDINQYFYKLTLNNPSVLKIGI